MPDPVWTGSYDFTKTPAENGFTLWVAEGDQPVITRITSGPINQRRVEVNTDAGGAYLQRDLPDLSRMSGMTLELELSSSGPGNAGFEVALPELFFAIHVYENDIRLYTADGQGPHSFPTASNANGCRVRVTFNGTVAKLFRNGTLLVQGNPPDLPLPYRRFQFWAEEGGVQAFRAVRWFTGGAVEPG